MRSAILNLPNIDKIDAVHRSVLENEEMSTKNTKTTLKTSAQEARRNKTKKGQQDRMEKKHKNTNDWKRTEIDKWDLKRFYVKGDISL